MKLTSPLKLIRHALVVLALMFSATAAHAVPTTDPSTIGTLAADALEYIETAKRYGEQVKKWQEELEQWTKTYTQLASGDISSITEAFGLGDVGQMIVDQKRKAAYDKFISDYQNNGRCERMSTKQQMAKSLCETRRNIEVAKLKQLVEMLDYTDTKNDEIKRAIKKADAIDGKTESTKKLSALAQVQTLQNNLKDGISKYTEAIKGYDMQVGMIKTQQAEVARMAMQGKPPGLLQGIASAAIMKGAFEAIKH